MGMSTHVKGFIRPDDEFKRMKQIWDLCETSGVSMPTEVYDYFDG